MLGTIRKNIDGLESEAFDASLVGVFIALGGNYAVGEMFKYVKVKGYTGFKNRIKEGPT